MGAPRKLFESREDIEKLIRKNLEEKETTKKLLLDQSLDSLRTYQDSFDLNLS